MQVKTTKQPNHKVKFQLTLTTEQLAQAKTVQLRKMAGSVKVAGFRAGKAPLQVVERQLDDNQLQAGVINQAINLALDEVVDQSGHQLLEQPKIEVSKFVPYSELEFTAEATVMPEIILGDYKKIKRPAPLVTVDAKEIQEVLNNIQKQSAERQEVKRAAKLGDEVLINFDGSNTKGEKVAGASGQGYALELGSNSFIAGFEDGLVGSKVGDKLELPLSFPKEYHAKELAGSKVTFRVELLAVKVIKPPALDDEFASKMGPFADLKEFKKDVKQQLAARKETEAIGQLKDSIVEELVKISKFEVPQLLIDDQLEMLEKDTTQNLLYRGITGPEYVAQLGFKDEAQWRTEVLVPQAKRRVSVGLILSEVAKQAAVLVDEEELAVQVANYKKQYQKQAAQFDTPQMRRELSSRLITEKTVELLYQLAIKQ